MRTKYTKSRHRGWDTELQAHLLHVMLHATDPAARLAAATLHAVLWGDGASAAWGEDLRERLEQAKVG